LKKSDLAIEEDEVVNIENEIFNLITFLELVILCCRGKNKTTIEISCEKIMGVNDILVFFNQAKN
jgi:hypothetical protein